MIKDTIKKMPTQKNKKQRKRKDGCNKIIELKGIVYVDMFDN